MKVNRFDEFRAPSRKPWLVLIALAIGAFFLLRNREAGKAPGKPEPAEPISAQDLQEEAPASSPERPKFAPPPPAPANLEETLKQARSLDRAGRFVLARTAYLRALKQTRSSATRADVERRLAVIHVALVMTPRPMPEKVDVVVKSGDSVGRFAAKHGTTIDLIAGSNDLANPNLIKAGDHLRVFTGKFSVEISKSRNDLVLFMNGEFFKRYPVGTGKHDKTPEGVFVITKKEKEPPWWRPDGRVIRYTGKPDGANILGTRWMSLKATGGTPDRRGYGIHGTWNENSIGKAESAGCVRLRNRDVEELFNFLPEGVPVVIRK